MYTHVHYTYNNKIQDLQLPPAQNPPCTARSLVLLGGRRGQAAAVRRSGAAAAGGVLPLARRGGRGQACASCLMGLGPQGGVRLNRFPALGTKTSQSLRKPVNPLGGGV